MSEFVNATREKSRRSNRIDQFEPNNKPHRVVNNFVNAHHPRGAGTGETIEIEVPVEVERSIQYELRGFYPTSGLHEYWQGSSVETPPPSGNPLIDISIMGQTT